MPNHNAKVWIVKENTVRSETGPVPMDYSPAMVYGDLEFITKHDMPLHPRSTLREAWMEELQRFLQQYNPEHDFIVCTGQPIAIMAIGIALGTVHKQARFLVWKREEGRYQPAHFDASRFIPLNFDA